MKIRQINDADIDSITNIYNWYILNTIITFELEAISSQEMKTRVHQKLEKYDWLVAELDETIVGYAYYGAFHPRAAYSHTVEFTIYLSQKHTGKGFGKVLYGDLIKSAEKKGFRELIGLIALPNQASTTLHQKLGFEEVGVLKKVGFKFGDYIDVGFWQKSLILSSP